MRVVFLALQIILHPKWGSAVYPATLFAKAPVEKLVEAIQEVEAALTADDKAL